MNQRVCGFTSKGRLESRSSIAGRARMALAISAAIIGSNLASGVPALALSSHYSYSIIAVATNEGTPQPGGLVVLQSPPVINDTGTVAFGADYYCGSVGEFKYCGAGYLYNPGSSLQQVGSFGDGAHYCEGTISRVSLNHSGHLELAARLIDGSSCGAVRIQNYIWNGNNITRISQRAWAGAEILSNDLVILQPNGSTGLYFYKNPKLVNIEPALQWYGDEPSVNDAGVIAYRAIGPAGFGIYEVNAHTRAATLVATETTSDESLLSAGISTESDIAYAARNLPGYPANTNGLVLLPHTGGQKVLAHFDNKCPLAGAPNCTYRDLPWTTSVNAKGQAVALMDTTSYDASGGAIGGYTSLVVNGAVIATKGDSINGYVIGEIQPTSNKAINNHGVIVFHSYAFDDLEASYDVVVEATPAK